MPRKTWGQDKNCHGKLPRATANYFFLWRSVHNFDFLCVRDSPATRWKQLDGQKSFSGKKTTGWRELITIRKISFISGQRLFAVKKDTWKYRYRVILYNITVQNLLLRPFREFFKPLPFFPNLKTDVSEVWFVFCVVWRLTFKWRHDKSIFRCRVTFITSAYKHKDSHA